MINLHKKQRSFTINNLTKSWVATDFCYLKLWKENMLKINSAKMRTGSQGKKIIGDDNVMIVMNVITISISFITDGYVIITDHDHDTIKVLYVKLNIS